jgi:hypothetical protein
MEPSRRIRYMTTIKPEHILEPVAERLCGGWDELDLAGQTFCRLSRMSIVPVSSPFFHDIVNRCVVISVPHSLL